MSERTIRIDCEWLPKRIYLATSPDVPGLIVETYRRATVYEYCAAMLPDLTDLDAADKVTLAFTFKGEPR